MSAVVILVPVLTAIPWGAIGAAIAGVAANMGMSVAAEADKESGGLFAHQGQAEGEGPRRRRRAPVRLSSRIHSFPRRISRS